MTPTISSIRSARRPIGARPLVVACLLAGLATTVGCSTQEKPAYEPVNTKPIVGDDAMAFRADWPKNVCPYPNGDVVAWSTRYPYQANEAKFGEANILLDTVTFVGETALLPFQFIANPPGQAQVWYGVKYPPTYTAQPPLPPKGGITSAYAQRTSAY